MNCKPVKILVLIGLLSAPSLCALNCPIEEKCWVDCSKTTDYAPEYETALDAAVKKTSEDTVGAAAVNIAWVKLKLKEIAPHMVSEDIDELADEYLEKFRSWMQANAAGIVAEAGSIAKANLNLSLKDENFKLKGLGVYVFCEDDFEGGKWMGLDTVLDDDFGGSAGFTAELEFNAGASFIGSAEMKIQVKISGTSSLLMQSVKSQTKIPNGTSATLSGLPQGKVEAKSSLEVQAGLSAQNETSSAKGFTNQERSIVTLTANEEDAECN